MTRAKRFDRLKVGDFQKHPVWEFANDLEAVAGTELMMRPVWELPVTTLANRVVGTQVTLHDGTSHWAVLGQSPSPPSFDPAVYYALHRTFGAWYDLARYFDSQYSRRGPSQLAEFLGLTVADVFPISYDISSVALGRQEVISGLILADAPRKLSKEELINLSLDNL